MYRPRPSTTVSVVNLSTGTVSATITVGTGPDGVAITPDGTKAYVANSASNTVTPITVATNAAGTPIGTGTTPLGVTFSPNGCYAYIANYTSNSVTPINVSTNTAGASISVGSQPWGIAAAPVARSYFYVTQATRNSWSSPNSNEASITVG